MIRIAFLISINSFLFSCSTSQTTTNSLYSINSESESNSEINKEITPFRDEIKDSMNLILSYTAIDFIKGQPNGNLNNLIADIILESGMSRVRLPNISYQNTLCLLNVGGLRAPINKGEITVRSCFEVMPFENQIVIVKMSYQDMLLLGKYLIDTGGHPVANFSMKTVVDMKIAGKTISEGTFYVITSDYLYNGGDNMTFFKDKEVVRTGYKIRKALIDYFSRHKKIENVNEKRLLF